MQSVLFSSFYSSSALLFSATLLWIIGRYKRQSKTAFSLHWIGLAIIFTFLSIDELLRYMKTLATS